MSKRKAHFPKRADASTSPNPKVATSTGDAWVRRTLIAKLLSDAHLGSGSGGGGIDALIARDRYNRPVIWASHVEGVLRDAARRLSGDAQAGGFFGRAGGHQQRAVFTSLYALTSPESRIWRSTARAAFDNRAPKDDTLRVVEYVPRGIKFVGEVELLESELPVLLRLLQEVDALGGGRTSGAGRVKLSLSDTTIRPGKRQGSPTGRLVLSLKSRDPLCIAATATPDNLIPSLPFVPGRTLLGAIAAWLIYEGQRETASILTSGRVSVGDVLPLPGEVSNLEEVELSPAPLSLQREKPKGVAGDVPWWAQPASPPRRLDAWETTSKLKRSEDDLFICRTSTNEPWTTFRPRRRVRLRNGRPDPSQTDTSLFAIEQIVEGTHFLAELRGSPDDLGKIADKLGPVLDGRRWLRVGRAGAPVEVTSLAWAGPRKATCVEGRALLLLTSDLLVRDEHLRWRTALDGAALKALLGADIQLGRSLQDSVMVNGFNGTSRLWRMPAAAIRRGSIFEVFGPGLAKIAQSAARGEWLGERTHEGFGRFRIDATLPGVTAPHSPSGTLNVAGDISDEGIAAKTNDWLRANSSLAKIDGGGDRRPSLSQWFDLVLDLERRDPNALTSRLNPTTAGGRSWRHKGAMAILEKLGDRALSAEQRAVHAHFFVRWLRAEMRKGDR